MGLSEEGRKRILKDREELVTKKLFLLDMDGTIYLDDELFDGTLDLLEYVKNIGGRYIFLTNNSSRGTESYIEKLGRLGIEAKPDDFVTSADATIWYLRKTYPMEMKYYLCGTKSLKSMFRKAGFHVTEKEEKADALILGYDTELTYQKLTDCVKMINRGLPYIATHPDLVCPVSYGYAPDCGSVINMLETCTGRRPEVIGKPQPEMVYLAMQKTGFRPEETCMTGDRIYTDIACGVNAGIDTFFVLSGEGTTEDIEKYGITPAYIFDNIREIADRLSAGGY